MKTKLYNFIELVRQFYCKTYEGILVDAQHITLNAPHYHKRTHRRYSFVLVHFMHLFIQRDNWCFGLTTRATIQPMNFVVLVLATIHPSCVWSQFKSIENLLVKLCTQGNENIGSIYEACMVSRQVSSPFIIAVN